MLLTESLLGSSSATAANYIEDVFSTYLYTGNNSNRSITNNIDLSTKGGLVWIKNRNVTGINHMLYDTARGANKRTSTSSVASESTQSNELTAFLTNGFSLGTDTNVNGTSSNTYVSWSFRKQSKFFDVIAYTGNGVAGRTISHSLGSVPGCIIIKQLSGTQPWTIYHRSIGNTQFLQFDSNAADTSSTRWNDTTPTSTNFTVGSGNSVNANGETYVAYLFAHDAGGFGAAGTDNVISCGSYTGNGTANAGPVVTLGYEPQWLLIKSTGSAYWLLVDNMRGTTSGGSNVLIPPLDAAELVNDSVYGIQLLPTGFQPTPSSTNSNINVSGQSYIYIAIRRGPMKTPTSGTSVFSPVARTGTGATATVTTNFPVDLIMTMYRGGGLSSGVWDRLRGIGPYLETTGTQAEATATNSISSLPNTAYVLGTDSSTDRINRSGYTYANWVFSRAPGFFDVVCYNGNGTNRTINHNLGVTPELIIVKGRVLTSPWSVYSAALANTERLVLNTTAGKATVTTVWNSTSPTASVFSLGTSSDVNSNYGSGAATFVAYLFATVAGVSKVGSYTGTGTTKQIDCGFTGGARFVLIKRTDSTGDWYVWDSARGIVAGNDPYLLLNSTAAEDTSTDYIDTYSAGFEISSTAPAAINANGGSFIFLAIA